MTDTLNWGLLGAGNIAKAFAKGVATSETGRVVAVGSRDQDKADRYVGELGLDGVTGHGSYEALLADDDVQAVYVATPHPMHAEWVIKAAEAGKHILCEKPVGLNHAEASAMIEAARQAGVFFMEAFMYRCHPQTAKLVEMIRAGAVGRVQLIDAAFAFRVGYGQPGLAPVRPEARRRGHPRRGQLHHLGRAAHRRGRHRQALCRTHRGQGGGPPRRDGRWTSGASQR